MTWSLEEKKYKFDLFFFLNFELFRPGTMHIIKVLQIKLYH